MCINICKKYLILEKRLPTMQALKSNINIVFSSHHIQFSLESSGIYLVWECIAGWHHIITIIIYMVGRIFFYLRYPVLTTSYQILYKSLKLGHCGQVDVFGIKSTLWCFQEYFVLILPSQNEGSYSIWKSGWV